MPEPAFLIKIETGACNFIRKKDSSVGVLL